MIIFPAVVITICLTVLVGYVMLKTEYSTIMKNWNSMRCIPFVMTMASQFKPPSDPRTPSQFATDNFTYCSQQLVQDSMSIAMSPFISMFGSQLSLSGTITDNLNGIRSIFSTIYNAFISYLEPFLKKYENIAVQIGIITSKLRSAFQRANATLLSAVFIGLSAVKGLLNSVDFIMKIVMVILGIMVALIILLFFILFPFIPLIMTVIGAIVGVASASVASTAQGYRGAFCFHSDTQIKLQDGSLVPICNIQNGDILWDNYGTVVATMIFDTEGSDNIYDYKGVVVSGDHLVEERGDASLPCQRKRPEEEARGEGRGRGQKKRPEENGGGFCAEYDAGAIAPSMKFRAEDSSSFPNGRGAEGGARPPHWNYVKNTKDAIKISNHIPTRMYCLNTTSHNIPVVSKNNNEQITFRDWEELPEEYTYIWTKLVRDILDLDTGDFQDFPTDLSQSSSTGFTGDTPVFITGKTEEKIPIKNIAIGDCVIACENSNENPIITPVIGIVKIHKSVPIINYYKKSISGKYIEKINKSKRNESCSSQESTCYYSLITAEGTYKIAPTSTSESGIYVRDFTEIGIANMIKSYPDIINILNSKINADRIRHQ